MRKEKATRYRTVTVPEGYELDESQKYLVSFGAKGNRHMRIFFKKVAN
jgi:hypothetical protein